MAGVGLVFSAAPASAATPCWKRLINDWYDGRIDKIYPVTCYREAMKHAGEDVQTYSTLPQDLTRALQSAIHTTAGKAVVPSGQRGRRIKRTTSASAPRSKPAKPAAKKKRRTTVVPSGPGRHKPKGFFPRALDFVGPDNASSIPLPLLFLAGLALVLTAAGAAGMVTRRLQARRAGGGAPPDTHDDS